VDTWPAGRESRHSLPTSRSGPHQQTQHRVTLDPTPPYTGGPAVQFSRHARDDTSDTTTVGDEITGPEGVNDHCCSPVSASTAYSVPAITVPMFALIPVPT